MLIRKGKRREINDIKTFIDSFEEIDTTEETYSKEYYEKLLDTGILLVATNNENIVGCCFGTYSEKENWADLLVLVVKEKERKKGVGKTLISEFEYLVKSKNISTIDLYGDKTQIDFFTNLGYTQGREYVSFRKELVLFN